MLATLPARLGYRSGAKVKVESFDVSMREPRKA